MSEVPNSESNTTVIPSPYPWPFDKLEARYIVTVPGRSGLFEALGPAFDERWILRALNEGSLPLVCVEASEVEGFPIPILHCYASCNRSVIVASVDGDEYDTSREDVPEVPGPLFQHVHASGVIAFADLARSAGFGMIELNNGYHAQRWTPEALIEECRSFASAE